jgi:hypothetical protein
VGVKRLHVVVVVVVVYFLFIVASLWNKHTEIGET